MQRVKVSNIITRRNLLKQLGILGGSCFLPNCSLFDNSPTCENLRNSGRAEVTSCETIIGNCNNSSPEYNFKIIERTSTSLLQADKLWESFGIGYSTVIYNGTKWQLWYESLDTKINDFSSYLCYAESRDGLRWEKPDLGLVFYKGNRKNNILIAGKNNCNGVHGPTVFLDEYAPASERYKIVYSKQYTGDLSWVYGAVSQDGIFWEKERCLLKRNSDTQTVCIRNKEKYILYNRLNRPTNEGTFKRAIGYSESATFASNSFCEPIEIFGPNESDILEMDFYNSAASKIHDNLYIMMPSAFYYKEDTVIPHIAYSKDGITFCRFNNDPFLSLGEDFDNMVIYISPGAISGPEKDTYWFYYTGVNIGHDQRNYKNAYSGGIGRFLLKVTKI